MSIEGLSEEDLAMLTEEERAGLLDDDGDEDEGEGTDGDNQDNDDAGDDDAGSDDDTKGDEADEGKSDGDDDQDGGNDGADQDDDKGGQDDDDDKVDSPPAPLFKAELPADIEAKRAALDTQEDELVKKWDEGEITTPEYHKELRGIYTERAALDRAELKAELALEAAQSQSQQTWQDTAQAFVAEHPIISKNETMWSSFDTVLRRITAETMSKGGQPGRRDLERALKQWKSDLGIEDTGTAKKDPEPKPAPKQKKQNVVPPNLGKVPAATANETDDGKFAHLDRLAESDPLAFEAALAKMSDAQRDEYMRAG